VFLFLSLTLLSASPPDQSPDFTLFEAKIRPVLVSKCYGCHSARLPSPKGEFALDTKDGLREGGATGVAIVPGQPEASRLLKALRYSDTELQMPPSGKLPDPVIADFEQWIAAGAPDPRTGPRSPIAGVGPKGMSLEDGRKWWAFQPLKGGAPPPTSDDRWAKNVIDSFVLAKQEQRGLSPSPAADPRTLVSRVYVDLVGYKPTYEEIEAFLADPAPDAFERLVDRLLASPPYGERWGRHWMDVARYGEDNPTGEATNPAYPYAWRYRDWIIEAINQDVPYDRFVKLQLAADLVPGASRADLRALGYLGAAPVYHKDLRLSEQVIGGFLTDDWDERIDATTRGLLAMTVACARCHDHKFDPIPTEDYYGLMGVFASTMRAERPLFAVDPQVELRSAWLQNRLFDLAYSVNLLTNEASTVVDSAARVATWRAEIEQLRQESLGLQEQYPQLFANLEKYWQPPGSRRLAGDVGSRNRNAASTQPFTNAVFEAAQYLDGSDPQFTFIHYKAGEARDVPLLKAGNLASPGDIVPRHFPAVLASSDPNFRQGSGRLELAEKVFSDAAPLAARVIVNRVWGWHMGRPLVGTPSDFGVQGEQPTHPELLDWLAGELIRGGWRLKPIHKLIITSATYQQKSGFRVQGSEKAGPFSLNPEPRTLNPSSVDPENTLLWRMNSRRLEIEAYRDTLLRLSGRLDERMYGPSDDLQSPRNVRRTVYGRVSRGRANSLLKNYDFPDAMQSAGGRDLTITPLQQLFVMNSAFMHEAAAELAAAVAPEPDNRARLRSLFRKTLGREPTPREMELALDFLPGGTIEQYAQALLSTNEEIFWP
jgi:Protein of unknown function (DUF1549)/Protein of unknown function (DUF1553)/Planctomycete cytochrome C